MTKWYLLEVWEGIEPQLHGPYVSGDARDEAGLQELADMEDPSGWFRLNVYDNTPFMDSFSRQEVDDYIAAHPTS